MQLSSIFIDFYKIIFYILLMIRKIIFPTFLLFMLLSVIIVSSTMGAPTAGPALTESEKIKLLLDKIEHSGLIFIRNETEYSSKKARIHLERKLSNAGSLIRTAKHFIEHIATKSSWTGKPYYVKFSNGKMIRSAVWLRRMLLEIEKK